jgi:hypothetical protein
MLKCWSPLGYEIPENVEIWAISRDFTRFHVISLEFTWFHVNSRDFTWVHVWYWAHFSPKMVAPPSRSPNVDQHLLNICWSTSRPPISNSPNVEQMFDVDHLSNCLINMFNSFDDPYSHETIQTSGLFGRKATLLKSK